MMWGVEIVEDKESKSWFGADFGVGGKLTKAMMDRGLSTRVRSEVICIAPPLTTDETTLDQIVDIVQDSVNAVF